MRNRLPLLAALAMAATFASGCAGPSAKLGRGMNYTFDMVRLGEFRHTEEQAYLWDGPEAIYGKGFVTGIGRTFARAGLGIYQIVTFPFPPYDPPMADYFSPGAVNPDSYSPNVVEDSMFVTDSNLGFGGGDVLPIVPGSRFRIFDTQ